MQLTQIQNISTEHRHKRYTFTLEMTNSSMCWSVASQHTFFSSIKLPWWVSIHS